MSDDERGRTRSEAAHCPGADAGDRLVAALNHLQGSLSTRRSSSWTEEFACQEACLREWADNLDLLIEPAELLPKLVKGGQENDYHIPDPGDRIVKVTKNGYFGLTPGLNLDLVAEGQDGRRFHLWDATPYHYLERLNLQNQLTGDLNVLEGLCDQGQDLAIVTSQPFFQGVYVTQGEIDSWFAAKGFRWITHSAYYRESDNLAVFDAHDKNVVRVADELIPFDVIPAHPRGGFLKFVEATLEAGERLSIHRTTQTKD